MGVINGYDTVHTQYIPRANIIFDHRRRPAQDAILTWLEQFGLQREPDDREARRASARLITGGRAVPRGLVRS